MSSNNKTNEPQQEVVDFSFKEFFQACLKKWPWFLICMIASLLIGYLYIYIQQPVYERSEEILITDSDAGGGVGDISSAFSSLGLFSNNTSVYNELISLKSPAVMYEVAQRLELDKNYIEKVAFLKKKTLYGGSLPVVVELLDVDPQGAASFNFDLNPDGSAHLYKFKRSTPDGKIKYSEECNLPKGAEIVKTPIGRVKISPNPAYTGEPLAEQMEIRFSKMPMQATVELYGNKLNGDLVDQDADVIGLSIKDVNVQRAVDILNTVLAIYNENWIEDKNKLAVATSAFIEERLKVIERELGDVDQTLAKYQTSTGSPDLASTATMSMERGFKLDQEITELSNMLAMSQYMKDYLADTSRQTTVIPANSGLGNIAIENEISNYNSLLLSRNNLASNSSDSNPLVVNYDSQLKEIRSSIRKAIDNNVSQLQTQINLLRKERAREEGKMLSTPTKALPLLSEGRQQMVKENLYLYLLQKREENELTQTFTAYNTRVITPPMGSLDPVAPRKVLIMVIAFLLGLAVPIGAMYMAESGNTTVRGRKDLENIKMPFAGEIPHVGKKKKLKVDTSGKRRKIKDEKPPMAVVEEGKRDIVNEAFRVIRSNIDFMAGKDSKCQVIMLTSFNPGSGKSFISYNLGLSFAIKRKRVLIIDCDLRHGSASMYVGMPPKGLTNYLTDATDDWKSLVVTSQASQYLSILPIGKMPPNPAELLENGRIAKLIEQAKADFDYVLLDCPPVNIVVDTQIVGQYADRTLFVVRAGLLERSALKELDEFYEEKRFKHMSLILNGTDAAHSRYYTYGTYQSHEG